MTCPRLLVRHALVSSRFAETRFAEIRVRVRVGVRLGFRERVRVGVSANRVSAKRD